MKLLLIGEALNLLGVSMRYSTKIYDSDDRPHPLVEEMQSLFSYRDLIRQFISRSIKTRYKRSFLGVVWTILNPLLTMIVITIVFSKLFRFRIENYHVYVLTGLIVWGFFTSATNSSMGDLVLSGKLINRIYMPKSIFAVSAVGTSLVNLGFSFIPLLIIMLFTGLRFSWALLTLPLATLLLLTFSLGIGLILSSAVVYYADMIPVYEVLLKIWIYATPIFYPEEILPAEVHALFQFNPMLHILKLFRAPLHQGVMPEPQTWLYASAASLVTLMVGAFLFTNKSRDYAYRV
jgi:ABC-type polysaccharide/polyol phosphate export permease